MSDKPDAEDIRFEFTRDTRYPDSVQEELEDVFTAIAQEAYRQQQDND